VSNSIVTGAGGGSNSSVPFRLIVTSSSTAITAWMSSEISTASRSRRDRRRGERFASASIRREPFSGMILDMAGD
jgi:hypothetical protein